MNYVASAASRDSFENLLIHGANERAGHCLSIQSQKPMHYSIRHSLKKTLASLACLVAVCATASPIASHSASVTHDANALSEAVAAFALCDSSFFELLGKQPQILGPGVEIEKNGQVAAPSVADPLSEGGRIQTFAKPVEVEGLRLVGWRNEVQYTTTLGALIWWGFDVEGKPDDVAAAVNRLLKPERRMQKIEGDWSRGEVRHLGDPIDAWKQGGQLGVVAAKGTVERVLLAEEEADRTKLYCSLQGSVTPPLLERVRPDLPTRLQQ